MSVVGLFGRYDYELPFPINSEYSQRLALFHGDNGSGKTTILRLLWHTLSSAESSGHRTFVSQTPFERFDIFLRDHATLSTVKTAGLLGTFTTTLKRSGQDDLQVTFEADDEFRIRGPRRSVAGRSLRGLSYEFTIGSDSSSELRRYAASQKKVEEARAAEAAFFEYLEEVAQEPLYLADDRSLYSDNEDIQRTRTLLAREEHYDRTEPVALSALVFQELRVTIQRVNMYLSRLALGGQNAGSVNSNTVYETLLRQLAAQQEVGVGASEGAPHEAIVMLEEIGAKADAYERYGLVPKIDVEIFTELLSNIGNTELARIAEQILKPYLSGLLARYAALEAAKNIIDTLISTVNSFLNDKHTTFSPSDGIRIISGDSTHAILPVESLSSGERQLLMLLCTTLLAREQTQVFIIDEPELSLGVEWQRAIIEALLGLTAGTDVQFLLATHSIEIISGAPDSLVMLHNER